MKDEASRKKKEEKLQFLYGSPEDKNIALRPPYITKVERSLHKGKNRTVLNFWHLQ